MWDKRVAKLLNKAGPTSQKSHFFVPDMTYNVFGGTLNLAQSISAEYFYHAAYLV